MTGLLIIWAVFALGAWKIRHDYRRRIREAKRDCRIELGFIEFRQLGEAGEVSLPEVRKY